jgi:G3E family GTPase
MKSIYLVTGFLGAGKTSFINGILKNIDQKVAVIVNEFGEEGIDGKLIQKESGVEIHEINNGSIFCCCKMMDFARALVEMAKLDIDTVIVEASGLADPSNLEDILAGANIGSNNAYIFKGSICIVDARNYLKLSTALPALVSQVEASNYILVNKCDLVDESTLEEIERELRKINENATIEMTTYSKMKSLPDKVLEPKPTKESNNTPFNRPETNVIYPGPISGNELMSFIEDIKKKAYRAKGFITLDGMKYYLDIVGDTHSIVKTKENSKDKIVLLSLKK